jgi:hypothetical protein
MGKGAHVYMCVREQKRGRETDKRMERRGLKIGLLLLWDLLSPHNLDEVDLLNSTFSPAGWLEPNP